MPDSVDEEREAQIRRRVRHFADTHTLSEDFRSYHYDDWMFLLRRLREDSAGPDRAYEAQLRQIISAMQDERDAARALAQTALTARDGAIMECAEIAKRYIDNPSSGSDNNTPEAFAVGMDHMAGAVDNADSIERAIRALSQRRPS